MHKFLKFIFGIELYMFRTGSILIRLANSQQTCMTYTYYRVYSTRLLMMDRETVRNM